MNALQRHVSVLFPPDVRRSWYSRWNGNRLDVYVRSNFAHSPEAFRDGVIDVGYLLQSLDQAVQKENQVLEIQSFPSLDQAQWVASVRLHRGGRKPAANHPEPIRTDDPVEALAELALDWNFSFLFLDRQESPLSLEESEPKPASNSYRGVLESSGNNPFVWLQIGRWLKEAESIIEQRAPKLQLYRQTSIPEKIQEEIPLLAEKDPWSNLTPEHRTTGGRTWTPQLLLQLRNKAE
ncbi:MAG: hypothetical protein ACQER4_07740 [Bacteroidota bacterium]